MSLLNNALREAEERQRRPDVTGAYTGAVQEGRSGNRWLIMLIFLLALALAAVGIYWFAIVDSSPPGITQKRDIVSVEEGQVERPTAVTPETVEPRKLGEPPMPVSEVMERAAPKKVETAAAPTPAPEAPESKAPEPTSPESTSPEPEAPEAQVASSPEPSPKASQPETGQAPVIKATPQSPLAIDRESARELEALIASGRMVEAERRLAILTQTQVAPRSRFVVARALVVDGEISRGLDWLPKRASASDSSLRMLRARALHADGRLAAAVATLESDIPEVAELPEYRVTLATLLQQQGQGQEAAAQWAELIAWDDSRAPWWVGLALALEDQGEMRGATRAYEQAAALPGLSPALADYVQRRLQSLRAG